MDVLVYHIYRKPPKFKIYYERGIFMSLDTNGMTAADVAAVVGNNRNNDGFGFGGDGAYLLLFLILCMGGWNGGMWGMNGGAMRSHADSISQQPQTPLTD